MCVCVCVYVYTCAQCDLKGHFDDTRKYWHIDGLPSKFIPGVTDHFGKVRVKGAGIGFRD